MFHGITHASKVHSTCRDDILLERKMEKEIGVEFSFISNDLILRQRFETNVANCSIPVVGV